MRRCTDDYIWYVYIEVVGKNTILYGNSQYVGNVDIGSIFHSFNKAFD